MKKNYASPSRHRHTISSTSPCSHSSFLPSFLTHLHLLPTTKGYCRWPWTEDWSETATKEELEITVILFWNSLNPLCLSIYLPACLPLSLSLSLSPPSRSLPLYVYLSNYLSRPIYISFFRFFLLPFFRPSICLSLHIKQIMNCDHTET